MSDLKVRYFGFGKEPKAVTPARTVHEQEDGTIYGVCATGTTTKDSALSWVRLLQKLKAPILEGLPVLFRFRQPTGDLVPFSEAVSSSSGDKT